MKDKGTIKQQIKKLERSIEKFGDPIRLGFTIGPKQQAIEDLKKAKK